MWTCALQAQVFAQSHTHIHMQQDELKIIAPSVGKGCVNQQCILLSEPALPRPAMPCRA